MKNYFFTYFVTSICIAISACSSGPKTFGIKGNGDPILNRDINGRSLSVVVRIYQLKDANEFSKLTFDVLADGHPESELLGPALLDKSDLVIVPGGSYASTEKLLDGTRFVGIVAFFRRPDAHLWRQLVSADTVRSKGLAFRVQDCYVALNDIKAIQLPDQSSELRPECSAPNATGTRPAPRQISNGRTSSQPTQGNGASNQGRRLPPNGDSTDSSDINVTASTPAGPVKIQIGKDGKTNIGLGGDAPNSTGSINFPR
ncbi:MAG: type VI secretion system lipoprotein TssJ [Rhodocyclales bacterium GT-UBC]|nr:MAG: type VI secretion system lipoprotein TssJ [Rhodocyclales bacterium GT-UBC]